MRRIYWFADKSFIGACDANEVLCWKPAPGVYQLMALDDHGRSAIAFGNLALIGDEKLRRSQTAATGNPPMSREYTLQRAPSVDGDQHRLRGGAE